MSHNASSTQRQLINWLSPAGKAYARRVLTERVSSWPDGPYEPQVCSVVHTASRVSQVIRMPTGGGKTALFAAPLILAQHLNENPSTEAIPMASKPVVIVVVPLIELANNHVHEMEKLGIKALALHADAILQARREGRDLYREIRECQWPIIFISPERLTSPELGEILRHKEFRSNIIALGLDEVHVIIPWGLDFRPAFHQIALVHRRLPEHVPIIAVSASLTFGKDLKELCNQLSLKPGQYYQLMLSNERRNVRSVMQTLTHPLAGNHFPDIDWVTSPKAKVVVYCKTVDLCYRVAMYLWSKYEPGRHRLKFVRLWTSLTPAAYNKQTLELYKDDTMTTIIVATIAFGMGMNVPNIRDVVNLGCPPTVHAVVQQEGRAGRDGKDEARGHTYVETSLLEAAAAVRPDDVPAPRRPKAPGRKPPPRNHCEGTDDYNPLSDSEVAVGTAAKRPRQVLDKTKRAGKGSSGRTKADKLKEAGEKMDPGLLRLLLAHLDRRCLVAEKNKFYGNTRLVNGKLAGLACKDAKRLYPCSSCHPFTYPRPSFPDSLSSAATRQPDNLPPTRPVIMYGPRLPAPLAADERKHAEKRLAEFAHVRWLLKAELRNTHGPSDALWKGISLRHVLDHFHLIRGDFGLREYLGKWVYIDEDGAELCKLAIPLNTRYDIRAVNRKRITLEKRRKTLAIKKEEAERAKPDHKHEDPLTRAVDDSPASVEYVAMLTQYFRTERPCT